MAEQDTSGEDAQMNNDILFKEFEPDANEIIFGQKTLPDRPLTTREASKRKKIIMKLIDQKLKFKLVELMRHQVTSNNKCTKETATTMPTVSQTINNSQSSHSFTNCYQSQPDWFPYAGLQQAEESWQRQHHCQAEWQSSYYNPSYGTVVEAFGNRHCSFQPNIHANIRHVHQNSSKSNESLKWKATQNPNLIRPAVVDVTKIKNTVSEYSRISTTTSVHVEEKPNEIGSTFRSSLISVRMKIFGFDFIESGA